MLKDMGRSNRKSNAAKGRRYSVSEKRAVLDYVERVNLENGRGGISAAARRFGVSPLTITNWMQSEGVAPAGKRKRPSADVFRRMADVHDRIVKTEAELASLRKEYAQLKAKL